MSYSPHERTSSASNPRLCRAGTELPLRSTMSSSTATTAFLIVISKPSAPPPNWPTDRPLRRRILPDAEHIEKSIGPTQFLKVFSAVSHSPSLAVSTPIDLHFLSFFRVTSP